MKNSVKIAIVGGGASGLMAAIVAARVEAQVTLFERQDRVGKKLLATGNGQCNMTNRDCSVNNFHGNNPAFVGSALEQFSVSETLAFFETIGVLYCEEMEGKIYPRTFQASTVLDALRFECERLGVTMQVSSPVEAVTATADGLQVSWAGKKEVFSKVIIAAGGRAAPSLGGTDSGIMLLTKLGHTATSMYPALVPLKTDASYNKHLAGVKVDAAGVVEINGLAIEEQCGEFLFTEYGLSGPLIFQMSHCVNSALEKGLRVRIVFDLFSNYTESELFEHLECRFLDRPELSLERAAIGLVHKKMIPALFREAGIPDISASSDSISDDEIMHCIELLKKWPFNIVGSLTWNEAQCMVGGISTSEFYMESCASKLVPGVYAVGEVLDIAGDCGGYNLQWAWSSAFVAATHAAGETPA